MRERLQCAGVCPEGLTLRSFYRQMDDAVSRVYIMFRIKDVFIENVLAE